MKQITIDAYTFDELSPEVKEKVLDKMRTEFVDTDIDGMQEDFANMLGERGYTNAKVSWSCSYSQGDGASFTSGCDTEILSKRSGIQASDGDEFRVKRIFSMYCHENTCIAEQVDGDNEELLKWIEDDRRDLCRQIYNAVKSEIEYEMSDEYIADTLTANEYLFTKMGDTIPQFCLA